MEWKQLLSLERYVEPPEEPAQFADYPINPFEKDFQTIITSAAFRRLQDKTQVYALDKSDFVRTRLTHSIEVSTVARQLGMMVTNNTTRYRPTDIDEETRLHIPSILACAGLIHDLGNPPFGHFGESNIGYWFTTHLDSLCYKGRPLRQWLTPQMCAELENFEGNAQALRLMSKVRLSGGMNLCYATVATLMKYPVDALSFDHDHEDIKFHKPGYFVAEQEVFDHIADLLGTRTADGVVQRHPLTYLLEAADDIAYAVADLEDGYKKRMFTLDALEAYFQEECDKVEKNEYLQRLLSHFKELRGAAQTADEDETAYKTWLQEVKQWLMYVVVYRFSSSYKEIMDGTYTQDLFYGTHHEKSIDIFKGAMRKFVYDSKQHSAMELSSARIIPTLLDIFVEGALYYDKGYAEGDYCMRPTDKKAIALFSENYKADYWADKTGDEAYDLYLRILMATDCVAGMTDTYARGLYREICGME